MALHITQILVKPLITEKNNLAREARNEVVFEIHPDANKAQVRAAVKQLFGVDVADVRTIAKAEAGFGKDGVLAQETAEDLNAFGVLRA